MRLVLIFCCLLTSFLKGFALAPVFEEIQKRGELVVALYNENVIPFIGVNEKGELQGHDIVLAELMAQSLGVKIRFDRSYPTFDSVIEGVAQNKADMGVSYLSRTDKRAESVLFSTPYLSVHFGLSINRQQLATEIEKYKPFVKQITEKKLPIAVLKNSSMAYVGKKIFHPDQLVYFDKHQDGFTATKEGKTFAYFTDEIMIGEYTLNNPNDAIYLKNLLFKDLFDTISIAIPPDKILLLFWTNLFLDGRQKETVPEIFQKFRQHKLESEVK